MNKRDFGENFSKLAKMCATDYVSETSVAFKSDQYIECDNAMKNRIKRVQHLLSKYTFN